MLRIYAYDKCDTCRKALKFLAARNIAVEVIPIRDRPPAQDELKRMLGSVGGDLRKLFNTSGQDYKSLRLKDKLASMSESQAFALLAKNGNLVKRPFVIGGTVGTVGFKEESWRKLFPG